MNICFSNRLEKVWMDHADTEVIVGFLLALWMDRKWSAVFQAGLRSTL